MNDGMWIPWIPVGLWAGYFLAYGIHGLWLRYAPSNTYPISDTHQQDYLKHVEAEAAARKKREKEEREEWNAAMAKLTEKERLLVYDAINFG